MNLQLVLIILLFLFAYIINSSLQSDLGRKYYIFVGCGLLLLAAALRSLGYGAEGSDTMTYYQSFENADNLSFSELWDLAISRYVYGSSEEDIGYLFLQKLIRFVTPDFHVYTFLAQLLFYIPFGIFLYRFGHSIQDLLFAFVFFVALVLTHAMTGARQFYAMGFGVLFFLNCYDKKYVRGAILLILGMSIHLSLLLVVLPVGLCFLNSKQLKAIHLVLFLVFPIVMLFPNQIIEFMGNLIGSEKYAEYGKQTSVGGTETFIFLLESLSLLCLIGIKHWQLNDVKNKTLYTMAPFFTFFGPLIFSNGSMIRVSMYFYLYLTLLVPLAMKGLFKEYKMALFIAIGLLSFLVIKNGSTYMFFWQVDPPQYW